MTTAHLSKHGGNGDQAIALSEKLKSHGSSLVDFQLLDTLQTWCPFNFSVNDYLHALFKSLLLT